MVIKHFECLRNGVFGLHIILIIFYSSMHVRASKDVLFKETVAGEFHMADFDVAWSDIDLLTCVIRCVKEFKTCYSVTYNTTTKLCIPGTWLVLNRTVGYRSQARGTIYSTGAWCDETAMFTYYRQRDVTTCYWVSDVQYNYNNSKEGCVVKDAHLYTIKDIEKFEILKKITSEPNNGIWIGLDDMKEENVFLWADDGSRLTESLKGAIFEAGQPDNWSNSEDCAYLQKNQNINDQNCDTALKFVCEKNPFSK